MRLALHRFPALAAAILVIGTLAGGCGSDQNGPSEPDATTDCPQNSWPPCPEPDVDARDTGWTPGNFATEFSGTDQYGDEVELRQFRGATTVLVFGATWCQPCRDDAAVFDETYEFLIEGLDAPVWIIDVLDDAHPELRQIEWSDIFGIDDPVLGGPRAQRAMFDFAIEAFPTKLVLDFEHRIVGRLRGSGQFEQVRAWVLEAEARREAVVDSDSR